jgi:hypothetical protein
MPLPPTEIRQLLRSLREQVAATPSKLGSHQLDAHWSLGYACGVAPEPWEMYRAARLLGMPCTQFFVEHEAEIVDALRQDATWELLRDHAVEKLALEAQLTDDERRFYASFADKVQFYDAAQSSWRTVDVPAIRWFDGREGYRKELQRDVTADEFKARYRRAIESQLRYLEQRANKDAACRKRFRDFERFVEGKGGPLQMAENNWAQIKNNEPRLKPLLRRYLAKLDSTRDFGKTLFGILRAAENRVRTAHGVAPVREASGRWR